MIGCLDIKPDVLEYLIKIYNEKFPNTDKEHIIQDGFNPCQIIMSINISAISNGFVMTVTTEKGQSATFFSSWSDVIIALEKMQTPNVKVVK